MVVVFKRKRMISSLSATKANETVCARNLDIPSTRNSMKAGFIASKQLTDFDNLKDLEW